MGLQTVNLFYILVVWEKRPIAFCLELLMNVNGFANGQPFLYIEGTNKQVINPLIHWT